MITSAIHELLEGRHLAKVAKLFGEAPEIGRIGEMSIRGVGKVDEKFSKTVMDQLGILAQKYPEVAARTPRVAIVGREAPKAVEKYWNNVRNPLGMAYLYGSADRHLGMEMVFHEPAMARNFNRTAAEGFTGMHSFSDRMANPHDQIRAVVSHEFGHHGNDLLMQRAMHAAGVETGYPGTHAQQLAVDHLFAGHEQWGEAIGSRYADENHLEAFAETFSAHEMGVVDHPRMAQLQERMRTAAPTPPPPAPRPPPGGRHSTARSGLPIRSSAPGRFRVPRPWSH